MNNKLNNNHSDLHTNYPVFSFSFPLFKIQIEGYKIAALNTLSRNTTNTQIIFTIYGKDSETDGDDQLTENWI